MIVMPTTISAMTRAIVAVYNTRGMPRAIPLSLIDRITRKLLQSLKNNSNCDLSAPPYFRIFKIRTDEAI
ncbi:hypothetical protein TcasGA2_TC010794 [Tribolium castaneum]|uniref:Uncharacterized protein n=1 Tax=Tribolium castaneum TaxID=7070 RepID=D6W7M0_TRICA|nr:hypothetical protein TcasGA2_TC010794 [Tribolium castaneum]